MKPSGVALPPVMIVDDDENHVLLLARRLKEAGVKSQLLHLRSGGEAFMYLKKFCPPGESGDAPLPALMFLDVNMPGLSGFDVLAWTRQQPALAGLKIVMVSAATEQWDAQIAAKLGADDYMLKFPTPAVLAEKIAALAAAGSAAPAPAPATAAVSNKP